VLFCLVYHDIRQVTAGCGVPYILSKMTSGLGQLLGPASEEVICPCHGRSTPSTDGAINGALRSYGYIYGE
jgi:hypothetical protein